MSKKLAAALLYQAAKDRRWDWAKTDAVTYWCQQAGIPVDHYREAMAFMAGKSEAQLKVYRGQLKKALRQT